MKRIPAIGLAWLLLLAAAYAQNEGDKSSGPAQLLTTGRITKIDTKKMVLKVSAMDDRATSTPPREPRDSDRRGGMGGRGGRRRGGSGYPGGIPFPMPGGGTPKNQSKEFKVVVTDKTVIKEGESRLSFLNLNVGDRISIQGLPMKGGGDDLEATQITLTSR